MKMDAETAVRYHMEMAFLAGIGYGQALLEESMENNLYDAFLGVIHAQKTGMPLHTVAGGADDSRPVRYCLRSNKWREAMFNSSKKDLEKYTEALESFFKRLEQMREQKEIA